MEAILSPSSSPPPHQNDLTEAYLINGNYQHDSITLRITSQGIEGQTRWYWVGDAASMQSVTAPPSVYLQPWNWNTAQREPISSSHPTTLLTEMGQATENVLVRIVCVLLVFHFIVSVRLLYSLIHWFSGHNCHTDCSSNQEDASPWLIDSEAVPMMAHVFCRVFVR